MDTLVKLSASNYYRELCGTNILPLSFRLWFISRYQYHTLGQTKLNTDFFNLWKNNQANLSRQLWLALFIMLKLFLFCFCTPDIPISKVAKLMGHKAALLVNGWVNPPASASIYSNFNTNGPSALCVSLLHTNNRARSHTHTYTPAYELHGGAANRYSFFSFRLSPISEKGPGGFCGAVVSSSPLSARRW